MPLLPPPPEGYAARVPWHEEAAELVSVGLDVFGREQRLAPGAAGAWLAMTNAGASDGVRLLLISGFRSVARQREIVARKLASGLDWEEILRVSAYPGYSEHHTGCAVDIGSAACAHLTEQFETTLEFQWLKMRAGEFGFTLSYPRDGRSGVAYEPWHWRWRRVARC
ncbi:MAG TPA: M15 family metallopeptidase [Opitutaceae bacterium]|nr:M15 family metallopeptidase [Opitutaceae bacterium]